MDISEGIKSFLDGSRSLESKDDHILCSGDLTEDWLGLLPILFARGLIDSLISVGGSKRDVESLGVVDLDKPVKVELLNRPVRKIVQIYESLDDLLAIRSNRYESPDSFYLMDSGYMFPQDKPEGLVSHYFEWLKVVSILIENSDHVDKYSNVISSLVFLHKNRFDLLISYSAADLGEALDGVSIVVDLFDSTEHEKQKSSILKEVLSGMLSEVSKEERLSFLLRSFGEFSKRISENYYYFVSDFSFDEVRLEYEEGKREYLTKLNDVFSAVQTKMLGIPISLALASLKMSALVDDITFWTNFMLLLAVLIYSVMMFMLIRNQRDTLSSIKFEYDSHMSRLQHQFSNQYDEIIKIKGDLDRRYSYQDSCLDWFNVMTITLLALVIVLFMWNLPWVEILL